MFGLKSKTPKKLDGDLSFLTNELIQNALEMGTETDTEQLEEQSYSLEIVESDAQPLNDNPNEWYIINSDSEFLKDTSDP